MTQRSFTKKSLAQRIQAGVAPFGSFVNGRLARQSLLAIAIRVGAMALGFAQAVLLARLLGAAGYGFVAIVLSAASIMAVFALMGLAGYGSREVARLRAREAYAELRAFVWQAGVFVLCASLTIGLIALVLGAAWNNEMGAALIWAAALVPFMALLLLFRGVSQGLGEIAAALSPGDVLRPFFVIAFSLVSYAVYGYFSYENVLAYIVAANAIAFIIAGVWLWRRQRFASVSSQESQASTPLRLRDAKKFFLLSILLIIQGEANTLLVGALADAREAGLFQAAFRLGMIVFIAKQAIDAPLAPRIVRYWEKQDREGLTRLVSSVSKVTAFSSSALCLAILLAGPMVLNVMGPDFHDAEGSLTILAVGVLAFGLCGPGAALLSMTGHERDVVESLFIAIALNLLVGTMFIPVSGAFGGAIATATGLILWNVLMARRVMMRLRIDPTVISVLAGSFSAEKAASR
ncbi:MAG: oligosaccharide flippase family protein [Pseudomonadota bacterium]